MTFSPKLSLLLLVAPFLHPADLSDQVKQSTFRSDAGMVLVPVTVMDRNGKTIDGLQRENFTVFDNQVRQPIVSFGRATRGA